MISADESAQRVYWTIALVLLLIAGTKIGEGFIRLARHWKEHHPITRSFLLLLIPDFLVILTYGPHHVVSLVTNSHLDNNWCSVVAFFGVSSVAAANMGALGIAFISEKAILQTSANRATFLSPKFLWKAIAASWLLAFFFSSLIAAYGSLGAYRDIYCAIKDPNDVVITVPWVLFVCSTGLFIWWTYRILRLEIQAQDGQWSTLGKHGYRICFTYFAAWSLTTFLALISVFIGLDYPIWLDIVATWVLKTGPILNSCVFIKAISATENDLFLQRGRELAAQSNSYSPVNNTPSLSTPIPTLVNSLSRSYQESPHHSPSSSHSNHNPQSKRKKKRGKGHKRAALEPQEETSLDGNGSKTSLIYASSLSTHFTSTPPSRLLSTPNPWPCLLPTIEERHWEVESENSVEKSESGTVELTPIGNQSLEEAENRKSTAEFLIC